MKIKPDISKSSTPTTKQKVSDLPPAQLLLYLSMFILLTVFIFILAAFVATKPSPEEIVLSDYFSVSTSILLLSSYPIARFTDLHKREKPHQLLRHLSIACFAGCLFGFLQVVGLLEMKTSGMLNSGRSTATFYVLFSFHLLHVLTMIIVTVWFMVSTYLKLSNPISTLMYFTNPYEAFRLKLLSQSWMFLQGLWVAIFTGLTLFK